VAVGRPQRPGHKVHGPAHRVHACTRAYTRPPPWTAWAVPLASPLMDRGLGCAATTSTRRFPLAATAAAATTDQRWIRQRGSTPRTVQAARGAGSPPWGLACCCTVVVIVKGAEVEGDGGVRPRGGGAALAALVLCQLGRFLVEYALPLVRAGHRALGPKAIRRFGAAVVAKIGASAERPRGGVTNSGLVTGGPETPIRLRSAWILSEVPGVTRLSDRISSTSESSASRIASSCWSIVVRAYCRDGVAAVAFSAVTRIRTIEVI